MALRLRVVGNQAKMLGDGASRVFGVHGGTIGRSSGNDWILPDPERYVSGRHARIEYRAGSYILHDTSSNGTYLNSGTDPVSATGPYELKEGDRLRMGDFEFVVSIDASNDFPPEKSAIVAYDGLGRSSHVRQSTENDLEEPLNLDALLASDDGSSADSGARMQPVNAYGQVVELEPVIPLPRVEPRHKEASAESKPAAPRPAAARPIASESGNWKLSSKAVSGEPEAGNITQVPWNLATRRIEPYRNPLNTPAPAESARPVEPAQVRGEASSSDGLQMLCRGAGIDPSSIPVHLQPQALLVAGQILREMMFGLMDVQQVRTEFRNRLQIPAGNGEADPADNGGGVKFTGGVEEGLRRLFEQRSGRYLGPAEAVRETFREIKAHQQATAVAMQAALGEVLSRLDPSDLQERFDRGLKRGGLPLKANKSRYWDLYAEFYPGLGVAPKGEMPHLFVEEFARAYQAKLAELASRPRNGSARRDEPDPLPAHAKF